MPDPGASGQFGPFLLLQYFGGLVVLLGLALAVYRGTRDRKLSPDQEGPPGAIRWYFDGPLNAALQTMRDTYKVMCSIDRHVETFGEEFRAHTRLLENIHQKLVEIKDIEIRRNGH